MRSDYQTEERRSLTARLLSVVTHRTHRITILILFSYVTAVIGLALVFLIDFEVSEGIMLPLGVALLFLSFVTLFYVSVTITNIGEGSDRLRRRK